MTTSIEFHPASMFDVYTLFIWRNDALTRQNSISTDVVPWESHVVWLESSIANPDRDLLIATFDGSKLGTIRIDEGKELSWTVAPDKRGCGAGKMMVSAVAKRGHIAHIKRENIASQKIAEYCGFELVHDGELQEWVKH